MFLWDFSSFKVLTEDIHKKSCDRIWIVPTLNVLNLRYSTLLLWILYTSYSTFTHLKNFRLKFLYSFVQLTKVLLLHCVAICNFSSYQKTYEIQTFSLSASIAVIKSIKLIIMTTWCKRKFGFLKEPITLVTPSSGT